MGIWSLKDYGFRMQDVGFRDFVFNHEGSVWVEGLQVFCKPQMPFRV